MALTNKIYSALAKSFKYEAVKKVKRKIRPLKHALFGTSGIYRAIELVKELEKRRGYKDTLTVFDIGAADGEYSRTFLDAFPKSAVWCFEPQSVSYNKLQQKLRRFSDRIKLFQFGFYNNNSTISLNLDVNHPDGSSILPQSECVQNVATEKISVRKLDDFVRGNNIPKIEFMKIDVEGVEKEVVEGGMETLKNKVDNLFIEISLSRKGSYSPNYIEVLKLINSCGFALIDISDNENFFFTKLI